MAESGSTGLRTSQSPGSAQSSSSSSYGKACVNCVKSKTRCSYSSNSVEKCDRCLRLNKYCQPAPTVRKKKVSKQPAASIASVANRTAALEGRLDDIIQLLHSQAAQPQQHVQQGTPTSSSSLHPSDRETSSAAQNGSLTALHGLSVAASCQSIVGMVAAQNAHLPYPLETQQECEEYLETYRSKMVPFFPIVVIPPEMTLLHFREQRPFLWLVIRAICSKNSARQRAFWQDIRKELGRQVIVEGMRNLDLLLGALVFAAWGYYCIYKKNIITADIQLALSIAYDLGLTKPAHTEPVMLNYNAQGCPKGPSNTTRTLEERRAIIGLFLISSVVANYFQRIEPLRWTPYLDQCLRLLDETQEASTDDLLVQLVRVQLLRNKVASVQWSHSCPPIDMKRSTFGPEASSNFTQDFFITAFIYQLEELKRTIPVQLKDNPTLQLQIFNTAVSIYEPSLLITTSKDISLDPTVQLQRIEYLWNCLSAVKAWFNTFWDLNIFPLSVYPHISMAVFTQAAHCMVALFRLTTFEAPGVPWDRQKVVREFDFGQLMKTWMDRWEGIPAAAGLDTDMSSETEDGPWVHTRKLLQGIVNWFEAKIKPVLEKETRMAQGEDQPLANGAPSMNGFEATEQQMEGIDFASVNLDFLDDEWTRHVLGSGYEFFREPQF